jgi:hypothetical protein
MFIKFLGLLQNSVDFTIEYDETSISITVTKGYQHQCLLHDCGRDKYGCNEGSASTQEYRVFH